MQRRLGILAGIAALIFAAAAVAESTTATGPLTGLWWNATEPGWGVHFTQRRDTVVAEWLTYDRRGHGTWYIAPGCALPSAGAASGTCSSTLYQAIGPSMFDGPFDPSQVIVFPAGSLQLAFHDANAATMTYSVREETRTVAIARQPLAAGPPPAIDYTDLWWNPSEPGWALTVAQQSDVLFFGLLMYDDDGFPTWDAGSCRLDGDTCTAMFYWTDSAPFGHPGRFVAYPLTGTVTVKFSDANNGTLTWSWGLMLSKTITRQVF